MEVEYRDITPTQVECILDEKTEVLDNKEVRLFKVKWKSTWEREDSLVKFCGDMIKTFWEKKSEIANKVSGKEFIQEDSPINDTTADRSINRDTIQLKQPLKASLVVHPEHCSTTINLLPSLFPTTNNILAFSTIPGVASSVDSSKICNNLNQSNITSVAVTNTHLVGEQNDIIQQSSLPLLEKISEKKLHPVELKPTSSISAERNGLYEEKNLLVDKESSNLQETHTEENTRLNNPSISEQVEEEDKGLTPVDNNSRMVAENTAIPIKTSSSLEDSRFIEIPLLEKISSPRVTRKQEARKKPVTKKRGRKCKPTKFDNSFTKEEQEIVTETDMISSVEDDFSEDSDIFEDNDDSDYIPDNEDEVTPNDMEINASEEKKPKKRGRKPKSKETETKQSKSKKDLDGSPLGKCAKCGKEHNKKSCPRCAKRKTCEICGHQFMNKCTKCAYTCSICGKICWKSYRLKQHVETIHERVKKYKCDTCGLLFVAQSRLTRHLDVHKKEPDLICMVCKKAFRHRTTFYRHRKIHSGIKPYKCPVCNRDFQQKEAMKTHLRIHSTGPKRFKCLLCEKDFNHKVSLKEHMSKHHNKDEQQAAVMIGLWKKYQMEEGLSIESPTPEGLLSRALNAVAMKPIDSVSSMSGSSSSSQNHTSASVSVNTTMLTQSSSHQQPHISLVDFPYIDFVNPEIQLPLQNYENRELPLTTSQQNRDISLITNTQAREIVMVGNPTIRELALGIPTNPREIILPPGNLVRPITLINHADGHEINLTTHLQTR